MSVTTRGFTFVAYSATLDVPRHLGEFLARHLAAQRRRIATPQGSRALGPYRQVVRVLRWFRERGGVSQATGYRCPHEGIDVLTDQAPDITAARVQVSACTPPSSARRVRSKGLCTWTCGCTTRCCGTCVRSVSAPPPSSSSSGGRWSTSRSARAGSATSPLRLWSSTGSGNDLR